MPSVPPFPPQSRRRIIRLSLAAVGASLVETTRSAAGATPTTATVRVEAARVGTIGPDFGGLSYEKAVMTQRLFTASNANLISLFQRLGPGVLRLGSNTVEKQVWTAGAEAGSAARSRRPMWMPWPGSSRRRAGNASTVSTSPGPPPKRPPRSWRPRR
jgi:hypothetical protein